MNVYLYVLNTMADWEIGFLTAELNSKRYFKDENLEIKIIKTGKTNDTIQTMGGFAIQPNISVGSLNIEEDDILILPGADTWLEEENNQILEIAKKRVDNNLKVAAICGGTVGLAKEGALNNIKHTSNDKEFLKMICPTYSGEKFYQKSPAVTDKNLVTASGLAPIEFTYEVLKLLGVFKTETLESWCKLYKTRESKYYFDLMNSITKD
ncbi:MAG: glutamine amidotransferase [bacterium]|nr:glutamine amidotransferase [bacterium]